MDTTSWWSARPLREDHSKRAHRGGTVRGFVATALVVGLVVQGGVAPTARASEPTAPSGESVVAPAGLRPAPPNLPQTPRVDTTPQLVDLTFPVAQPDRSVSFIDDFLFLRGGGTRLHAATDVMTPKHRPVHAVVGGVVSFAPYSPGRDGWSELGEPSYGWMLNIQGDDGRRYSYVHLNNDTPERDDEGRWLDDDLGGFQHAYAPRIAERIAELGRGLHAGDGVRVARGELIGWVGDSGNAKGVAPHLHLEIHVPHPDGEYRINPYHSLQAALARGDIPGQVRPAPELAAGPYLDVAAEGAHTAAILRLTESGLVRGCGPAVFCPHQPVTRDDIAAAVAAALGLDGQAALAARGGTGFSDVPRSHPDAGAIAAVAHAGVMGGYGDGRFGPDDTFSREQLATVLVQGFELPAARRAAPFDDVPPGAVHGASIAAASEAGLTSGCGDGTRFCRAVSVTRGQVASFLDAALARRL